MFLNKSIRPEPVKNERQERGVSKGSPLRQKSRPAAGGKQILSARKIRPSDSSGSVQTRNAGGSFRLFHLPQTSLFRLKSAEKSSRPDTGRDFKSEAVKREICCVIR